MNKQPMIRMSVLFLIAAAFAATISASSQTPLPNIMLVVGLSLAALVAGMAVAIPAKKPVPVRVRRMR
jgi:biopolymer transport protein ExbB/TolQ